MCKSNSTTWSNHVSLICQQYGLPSPRHLLQSAPWTKNTWSSFIKTKIISWHENHLRNLSVTNSKMSFLNTQLLGLSGHPHPALRDIYSTQDVKKLRMHVKFLTCDVQSYVFSDNHGSCSLCSAEADIAHLLTSCPATKEVKERLFPTLVNSVLVVQPSCGILTKHPSNQTLAQFIVDCTSINLPEDIRVPAHNPDIGKLFSVSRDWCYAICNERSRHLRLIRQNEAKTTL